MSNQAAQRVWFVRPGEGSRLWEQFESERVIGIGYSLEKSRTDITTLDRSDIAEVLRAVKPGESSGAIASFTGQVWRFAHEMGIGDVVVVPRDAGRTVGVGRVVGPCRRGGSVRAYVRNVRWIDTAVRVDDPELQRSLNAQGTVWEPRAPGAVASLTTLLVPILAGRPGLGADTSHGDVSGTRASTASWDERALLADIAEVAAMDTPRRLTRPGVDSFIRSVVSTRGGPDGLLDTDSAFSWLLDDLGDPLDPVLDWSDDRPTIAGWRKVRRLLRGEPFAFILNVADNEASREYADVLGESYGFDSQVSGHKALVESGVGSRVLFYGTRNAEAVPQMAIFGDGVIEAIADTGRDTTSGKTWYRATIGGFRWFPDPLQAEAIEVDGWNHQHGITEVTFGTYRAAVREGTGVDVARDAGVGKTPRTRVNRFGRLPRIDAPVPDGLSLSIPHFLPATVVQTDPSAPTADDDEEIARSAGSARTPRERQVDKVVEGRAVHIACALLERQGWQRVADRQRDGVGYDFEYRKDERSLHVEVKGVRGDELRFNMTGKEWRRAAEDPDFVVVAITRTLAEEPVPHFLTRDRLATAQARLVQVRLRLSG